MGIRVPKINTYRAIQKTGISVFKTQKYKKHCSFLKVCLLKLYSKSKVPALPVKN